MTSDTRLINGFRHRSQHRTLPKTHLSTPVSEGGLLRSGGRGVDLNERLGLFNFHFFLSMIQARTVQDFAHGW